MLFNCFKYFDNLIRHLVLTFLTAVIEKIVNEHLPFIFAQLILSCHLTFYAPPLSRIACDHSCNSGDYFLVPNSPETTYQGYIYILHR